MPAYDQRLNDALDAAERGFAREGYGLATMRDVAAATHLSVAGLYYYLPSKERALFLICRRAFAVLAQRLDEALAQSTDPVNQLRAFVRGHVAFITEHPDAYRVLLRDMDALTGSDRATMQEERRRYFARASDLIIAVQQQRPSAVSTYVAAGALFGMMNWTPMWYHQGRSDAADIADEMSRLFLQGVAA